MFSNSRFEVGNSVLAHFNDTITSESSFSKICEFTEKKRNIIKCIIGYVMNTMSCSLRKSTEHRSGSNIKYMSILSGRMAGKDSSDRLINKS